MKLYFYILNNRSLPLKSRSNLIFFWKAREKIWFYWHSPITIPIDWASCVFFKWWGWLLSIKIINNYCTQTINVDVFSKTVFSWLFYNSRRNSEYFAYAFNTSKYTLNFLSISRTQFPLFFHHSRDLELI